MADIFTPGGGSFQGSGGASGDWGAPAGSAPVNATGINLTALGGAPSSPSVPSNGVDVPGTTADPGILSGLASSAGRALSYIADLPARALTGVGSALGQGVAGAVSPVVGSLLPLVIALGAILILSGGLQVGPLRVGRQ